MSILFKFELKTARLSPDAFSSNDSVIAFLRTMNTTDCTKVNMMLSADKHMGLAGWLKQFAQLLGQAITQEVQHIKVGGSYDDGTAETLDLLKYKREDIVKLNLTTLRTISFEDRKAALTMAYFRNKEDLYELYHKN